MNRGAWRGWDRRGEALRSITDRGVASISRLQKTIVVHSVGDAMTTSPELSPFQAAQELQL